MICASAGMFFYTVLPFLMYVWIQIKIMTSFVCLDLFMLRAKTEWKWTLHCRHKNRTYEYENENENKVLQEEKNIDCIKFTNKHAWRGAGMRVHVHATCIFHMFKQKMVASFMKLKLINVCAFFTLYFKFIYWFN